MAGYKIQETEGAPPESGASHPKVENAPASENTADLSQSTQPLVCCSAAAACSTILQESVGVKLPAVPRLGLARLGLLWIAVVVAMAASRVPCDWPDRLRKRHTNRRSSSGSIEGIGHPSQDPLLHAPPIFGRNAKKIISIPFSSWLPVYGTVCRA